MPGQLRKVAAATAALALIVTPTGAIASTRPAAPAASAQWATLGAMTTSTASTTSLAAAQDGFAYDRGVGGIPLPVIAVWLAALGLVIWMLTHDDDGDLGFPISPD